VKGSLDNEDDVKKSQEEGGGGRSFIKVEKKTFIRLYSKDFNAEYSHILKLESGWTNIVCLGGTEGKGYAPEKCPICARAKKHWDNIKKLKKKKGQLKGAVKGQRPAYSALARDFISHTVYDRYQLFAGAKFKGPAIVEERESTVVVGEDATARVDEYGFLWIDLPGGK